MIRQPHTFAGIDTAVVAVGAFATVAVAVWHKESIDANEDVLLNAEVGATFADSRLFYAMPETKGRWLASTLQAWVRIDGLRQSVRRMSRSVPAAHLEASMLYGSGSVAWRLVTLCLLSLLSLPSWAEQRLPLSPRQEAWLKEHPTIVLGVYDKGWPPYEVVNNGQLDGLGLDYLKEMATRLGVQVQVRIYPEWSQAMEDACAGKLDVLMNLALTAERTRCLVYTRKYTEAPVAVVGRARDMRLTAPDLKGLRVVTEKDSAVYQPAREYYPQAVHLTAESAADALRMVAAGDADAYLGNPQVAATLIAEMHLLRLALRRSTDLPVDTLHFAVPNDKAPLVEALDIALASISEARHHDLRLRWLAPLHWEGGGLNFSQAEKEALAQPIRLAFASNWAPLTFLDEEGNVSGLAGEYLRRFRSLGASNLQMIGMATWQDIMAGAQNGEVDAAIVAADSISWLGDDWVASEPFLTMPNVIVMRGNSEGVLDLGDLDGRMIALSNPERLRTAVLAQAPKARIVTAYGTPQGLEMLRNGDVDAFVGNLAVIDRFLHEQYAGKLEIVAPAGIVDDIVLAARGSHAPLVAAVDRMLLAMSPGEREAVRGNWLAVEYRSGLQWRALLRWLVPALLVLFTAAVVHGFGHVRLRREVAERRRLEKRMVEVTGNLPAVVYQLRREPDGSLAFSFIVGDMPSLFGVSAEQALRNERDLFARVHPEDQPRLIEAMARSEAELVPLDLEFRGLSDDGWCWVRSYGLPHRTEDGAFQWNGYWVDVTRAHQQSEELAAAKAAAEQATSAKSEFLATMSHEIRTPMSGILGMVERLAQTRLDHDQRRVLTSITESARMLRQILDDILDFSKMEADALALEVTPVRLRRIMDSVWELLDPQASAKGVRFEIRVDDGIAEAHGADGVRLRQILFNLTSNAIKFTGQGGVEIALDLLEDLGDEQRLRLSVTDTGVGMTEKQQAGLFQPFFQADASVARVYGGTGLGLSICRRLVEMMSGELRLSSSPGVGTRVEVELRLPLADPGAADALYLVSDNVVSTTDSVAWNGYRVLLVEDHHVNRDVIQWRARQLGLECEAVDGAAAALAALERQHFDLVVTDCRMPGMDGYALAREIRRREAEQNTSRLPMVALSASALPEEVVRCREAGMDDFLAKPVSLTVLRDTIARWLPKTAEPADASGQNLRMESVQGTTPSMRILVLSEDEGFDDAAIGKALGPLGIEQEVVRQAEDAWHRREEGKHILMLVAVRVWEVACESVERWRAREIERGLGHLPVFGIADVTGTDELRRGLDSGMDGILKRPLNVEELRSTIRLWCDTIPAGGEQALDVDNASMLGDLAHQYRNALLLDLARLAAAQARDDTRARMHHAHRLKGAAAMAGLDDLADWADAVEYGREDTGMHERIAHFMERLAGLEK